MTDREININAKIANLQAIKDQLSKVNVNLNVKNSPEIEQLLKAAQKGLTIDIRFKVGPELKQLLDLQRKGLNLRYSGTGGSGASPKGSGNFFSSGQTFYGGAGGSFMNQDQFKAQNQARAKSAEYQKNLQASLNSIDQGNAELAAQQRQFDRQREQIDRQRQAEVRRQGKALQRVRANQAKANAYVEENPFSALLGQDVIGQATEKFGVRRSSIGTKPNFFNLNRLRNPDIFKDILFTTLLGGKIQGLGAAAGAATFGREGTLIGANVAQATADVFSSVAEAMTKAVRAGAEYERAVTGITGIFQATSEVVGKDGRPVGIGEALGFQRARATRIQDASQKALLPIGISGEAASALTKSYAAGLAQRGISPDEKSTGIVIKRLGAAIQTLQPELANDANALQRTVEDIIGGSPQAQRTELGSAIKGLAPDLFKGGIRTNEDIVKATNSLEALVEALRNNDTATVQWQKALGALQLAQQELGRGVLEGLAPGLKTLADELSKADTQDGLRQLGQLIGEVGSALIKTLVPALQNFLDLIRGGGAILSGVSKAKDQFAKGDFSGGAKTLGDLVTKPNTVAEKDKDLSKSNDVRKAQGLPPLVKLPDGSLAPESITDKGYSTRASLQSVLLTAKNQFGIENPQLQAENSVRESSTNKLRGLSSLRSTLLARSGNRSFSDVTQEQIGLNSQEIALRRQRQAERNELFDTGDFGQQRRALDEKGGLRDQVKLAEDTVSKRKQLLNASLLGTKNEEAIAQARIGVQQAEEEAIKLRNEVASKEKELAERRQAIFQKQLSTIDQTTFAGKDQALNLSKEFNLNQGLDIGRRIQAQDAIINSKTASSVEIQVAKDRRSELEIQQQSNQSAKAQDLRQGARNDLSKLAFGIQQPLRREAQADALAKSNLELKQLEFSTKELALEQNKLARSTAEANKALQDFSNDAKLRELGRQGEEIAAAEAIVAAGGAVPSGVSESLVRGSAGFDPEDRSAFELQVAQERFGQVTRQNDFERTTVEGNFGTGAQSLKDTVTGNALSQERLNLKPEELALQRKSLLRDQKTQLIENAQAAQAALEQDPDNPALQAEYQQAYQKLQGLKKTEAEAGAPKPSGASTPSVPGRKGSFSINGEPVVPGAIPGGINISQGFDMTATPGYVIGGTTGQYAFDEDLKSKDPYRLDYTNTEKNLQGISSKFGSGKKLQVETDDINGNVARLRGLFSKQNSAASNAEGVLNQYKDKVPPTQGKDVNGGASVFDKLEAKLPSKQDFQDAMVAALNSQFT